MLAPYFFLFILGLSVTVANARNTKRGLAYPNEPAHMRDISKAYGTSISWTYNWAVDPLAAIPQGIEPVPMQWGVQGVESFRNLVVQKGYKAILGFNEPDLQSQSNISPSQAATLWETHIQPLKQQGIRLGSPAISSAPAPAGKAWLRAFLDQCRSCDIDFIAVHWYGEGAQNFINYLNDVHVTFPGYLIWVTEFGCTSGNDNGEHTPLHPPPSTLHPAR
ncbi:glycosyl hydrolase 53 domain-containing protein [Moniliophthora roreri MCA 2997]|uniref:Glycosyl hydrolase 53 domain-containing protein n=1 Tax=Moniliophthora roreri (strain MCA 2997) TaxID=1381753 RepID=V2XQG2_MONRO|nr:glycosyl hydrolase 53 domain-containing protein [Moniliophthora roreri MCA 2997]